MGNKKYKISFKYRLQSEYTSGAVIHFAGY